MNKKVMVSTALVALLALGGYWYASPAIAVHQMKQAAAAGDVDLLNNYIDYPRVRESLKGQVSAYTIKEMAGKEGQPGAALGSMLGLAIVDRMVDTLVRPETIMLAMNGGKQASAGSDSTGSTEPKLERIWNSERKGFDKYLLYPEKIYVSETRDVTLVFERSGFATWKLVEFRVNMDKVGGK